MFYQKVKRKVQCTLCPHMCILQEGKAGICGVRQNIGGKIKCQVYGLVSGYNFDPIEKKPLYHFYPGTRILSVGSFGCNLNCNFCQNWQISQATRLEDLKREQKPIDSIIKDALSDNDNIGLAYTYNEPSVWYEFMYDLAVEVRQHGLKNVMVSNGYINPEPLEYLVEYMDAFNIDLKAFTDSFYKEMAGGLLAPVKESLKLIVKHKKHLELTTLVIPRKNDHPDHFREMIHWIADELGDETVLHLSRYFPKYKQSLPPTPESALVELAEAAREKLKYVYLGNLQNDEFSSTICPDCGSELIKRNGYHITFTKNYKAGKCTGCNTQIIANDKMVQY